MIRYLTLITLTDQGVRDIGDSVQRASVFAESVRNAGGKLLSQTWTVGQYDGCVVFEAPDELTGASLLLNLEKGGNVRTLSMRCYDRQEFEQILQVSP
ncbi:GYD domain-containing protein [Roseiconus nitratireducens]|uniref:GYD domain-containing protein n=1 Tax=Roseiconus nitratireducens TaxID=2605748 RepID=A0A5M6D270_9BACT|nr:GYD domain-containing protein [Roseiconus nitratireducens]KAA5539759.1 GYD domain-containing protein [Roseiconus nitratireducens]